ncbi:beta-galactosidase [Niabella hirudinis]|uniref:beta-galactosidase n=1 Tax=Niabella hirudinis TaxID=1285929 RepID=UPI003EB735DB
MRRITGIYLLLLWMGLAAIPAVYGQKQVPAVWTADNGNGTYKNPFLWGDWPDPDITRVGDEYYMVSTSMHYVPGCPVLKSKDLVNWELASYAVERYDEDPRYNLQGGEMYLRGSWAATIRHHKGLFYVGFCTPNWGKEKGQFSICTAKDIKGPWKRTVFPEYLYDPGLFFDDDGKVYVVHGQHHLYVTELAADALSVKGEKKLIWDKGIPVPEGSSAPKGNYGMEGSHVSKINGYYYITCPAGGTEGWQVCLRSKNIYGPYESKIIVQDESSYPQNGLHQGGMIQVQDGSWWFIIMQDRGPMGRVPHLEPVVWKEGWPMIGKNGEGKGVVVHTKPGVGKTYPVIVPATSDEFSSKKLGLQWQWNHNPDNSKWSLTERPGYLRLHGGYAKDLLNARNSLSQRVQGPASAAVTELDFGHMKDGDMAGLAVFEKPYAFVGVEQKGAQRQLVMINNGKTVDSVALPKTTKIWLKAAATDKGFIATFFYSLDGKDFRPFGNELKMGLGLTWTANRFMLFHFNTRSATNAGYADFNWFRFTGSNELPAMNDRISYSGDCMRIDGKDLFIYSAAFHYYLTPQELWRDRFRKIKAAGINTVETYIPWNITELNMPSGVADQSKFDFTTLKAYLKMASDEFGLYVIARPGPFICAEWAGGGYPRWLAKFLPKNIPDEFWLRSNEPEHVKWSLHWFDAVNKVLAGYQLTAKPRGSKGVIMVQIENEYNAHGAKGKDQFLKALYHSVRNAGINLPVFTCLTNETRGSKDPVLKEVFDTDNFYVGLREAPSCAQRIMSLRKRQPGAPAFVTELQGGWFSTTKGALSEDHYSDYRHYRAITLMSILGGATGINTYMFAGGTHFANWGARGQTATYDYNAPIRENGALSKKYEVAKLVSRFIQTYQDQLLHSKGGPCSITGVPASVYGGVRTAANGTRFVFLHNTHPDSAVSGRATLIPGSTALIKDPIYNIDQNGNKVFLLAGGDTANRSVQGLPAFDISYQLDGLGTKVLVIPPGKQAAQGTWWFEDQVMDPVVKSDPINIRIKTALKRDEDFKVTWKNINGQSLPELNINDPRYVLYRSAPVVRDPATFTRLLFNTYSRDIISVQVNGKIAPRLYPSDKYAAEATRNVGKSFARIRPDEFDNAFDISGLLKPGKNEIIALYENIGHEHGYVPMEELCGIRRAGLSDTLSSISQELSWQLGGQLSGIQNGWTGSKVSNIGWKTVALDTEMKIPAKGNNLQPKGTQEALMTWYRVAFSIPASKAEQQRTWKALINASGVGDIYLNGHNIGRHWEVGPQRAFYLPECWLKTGPAATNIIAIGLRQTMNGAVLKAMEIASY